MVTFEPSRMPSFVAKGVLKSSATVINIAKGEVDKSHTVAAPLNAWRATEHVVGLNSQLIERSL